MTPLSNLWREVPKAPVPSAASPYSVWTGEEMIVWGGTSGGATFQPSTDSWRKIANAPMRSAFQNAVWTGEYMVVQVGMSNQLMAYSPEKDEWAVLPKPPKQTGVVAQLTWTGDEVIVWAASIPA